MQAQRYFRAKRFLASPVRAICSRARVLENLKFEKVVRAVKKQAPKAIRASLALLDEFGNPDQRQKVAMARKAASIVKGAGPPPGHKLRKLCN